MRYSGVGTGVSVATVVGNGVTVTVLVVVGALVAAGVGEYCACMVNCTEPFGMNPSFVAGFPSLSW